MINTKPDRFEIFLASLMTSTNALEQLLENTGVSLEVLAVIRAEEEAAGFWTVPSLSYFEERLVLVGSDPIFNVAVPVETGTYRFRFALNLWPDFELGVLMGLDNVPFYPHFVRREGTEPVLPVDIRTISPWTATLEEILARFGPALVKDAWDLRRWLTYAIGAENWIITFDLGLVQNVHPASVQEFTSN